MGHPWVTKDGLQIELESEVMNGKVNISLEFKKTNIFLIQNGADILPLFPCQCDKRYMYCETCPRWATKKSRQYKLLKDRLKLSAGRKYCRNAPPEHSAILLTCIL